MKGVKNKTGGIIFYAISILEFHKIRAEQMEDKN
jgi:hypothetical protein